jgi:hypothetical protein
MGAATLPVETALRLLHHQTFEQLDAGDAVLFAPTLLASCACEVV